MAAAAAEEPGKGGNMRLSEVHESDEPVEEVEAAGTHEGSRWQRCMFSGDKRAAGRG